MRERSIAEDGIIKIRPPKFSDIPILHRSIYAEPQITIPAGFSPHKGLLYSYLDFLLSKLNLFLNYWCVVDSKNEICGVVQVLEKKRYYTLRVMLGKRFWGKGIGHRSISLSILTFSNSNKPFYAFTNKDNLRSQEVLKSVGFCKTSETNNTLMYKLIRY